jgi:hypothetical protein
MVSRKKLKKIRRVSVMPNMKRVQGSEGIIRHRFQNVCVYDFKVFRKTKQEWCATPGKSAAFE